MGENWIMERLIGSEKARMILFLKSTRTSCPFLSIVLHGNKLCPYFNKLPLTEIAHHDIVTDANKKGGVCTTQV
jgi:hypothetical protein